MAQILSPAQQALTSPLRTMSAEAFLRWEHEGLAEWVNGEVYQTAVTHEHQRVVDFLNRLLGLFAQLFNLGVVRSAPYAMRLADSIREPDLMFVSTAHQSRVQHDALDGPADLVMEVVSDESVARDYDEKFAEYQVSGVREYWVIDPRPNRQRVSLFKRDLQGQFQPVPPSEGGFYRSDVLPGFWLKPSWLWEETPEPNVLAALAEMIGSEQLLALLRANVARAT